MAKFNVGDPVYWKSSFGRERTPGKVTRIEHKEDGTEIHSDWGNGGAYDGFMWEDDVFFDTDYVSEIYKVGDILVDEDGEEAVVAGVVGMIIFLMYTSGVSFGYYSYHEMQDMYTKKKEVSEDDEPEVHEFTMDEVADKMGVSVDKLRIKKED